VSLLKTGDTEDPYGSKDSAADTDSDPYGSKNNTAGLPTSMPAGI